MKNKTNTEIQPNDIWNEKTLSSITAFTIGVISAKKEFKKAIRDLKNKYNSWLKEKENIKLTKTINQEEVLKLRTKLELITEIENKFIK